MVADDIVTRLREHYDDPADFTFADLVEAADEIERLRAENISLHRAVSEQNRMNRLVNIVSPDNANSAYTNPSE